MKRINFLFIASVLSFGVAFAQSSEPCGTDVIKSRLLQSNPPLHQKKQQFEEGVANYINSNSGAERSGPRIIPTVFHIMHKNGPENISKEQVLDALRVINEDFRRTNTDSVNTRAVFKPAAADCNIEFRLATIDPQGNCTDGITRTVFPLTYNANDNAKDASQSGIDAWPTNKYFNIWVVGNIDIGNPGVIGYAYYPYWGMWDVYGTVISNTWTGTIGTAFGKNGRTLTHEVGHCFGLAHTFDDGCGNNCTNSGDNVCDTPPSPNPTYGCNTIQNLCSNDMVGPSFYATDVPDQIENYMSYDACQNMFTKGQKLRMEAAFAQVAQIDNLSSAANLLATGVTNPVNPGTCALVTDFTTDKYVVCLGSTIQLNSIVQNGNASSYSWQITGPENFSSADPAPAVTFSQPGIYSVQLTASNTSGNYTKTKNNFILILDTIGINSTEFYDGFDNAPVTNNKWFLQNDSWGNGFAEKNNIGYSQNTSIWINNFANQLPGRYQIISPAYDISDINDPKINFKVAYARRSSEDNEILRVWLSNDCGSSWQLRFAKSKDAIASANMISSPFIPGQGQWNSFTMVVPPSMVGSKNLRLKFMFDSNGGNNLYIDDINISAVASVEEAEGALNSLNIYPNPASDILKIDLESNKNTTISFKITDLSGRIILNEDTKEIFAGSNTLSVNLSSQSIANGIYIFTLNNGAKNYAKKIAIIK